MIKIRPIVAFQFFLFYLIAASLVLANQESDEPAVEYPDTIAQRLQQRYDNMHSLSFNFFQSTRGDMTGRPRKGSGKAVFYKGDVNAKMRWDYFSPDKQVLISDGTTFRMYFAELNQMIVTPAENLEADLTYSFFTGKGNLQEDFYIRPPDNDSQSDSETEVKVIKLIPQANQSQVQDIHLWVTSDSLIRRIKILDHFGTITVLNLSDIVVDSLKGKNMAERKELFSFTPPEGTERIDQ